MEAEDVTALCLRCVFQNRTGPELCKHPIFIGVYLISERDHLTNDSSRGGSKKRSTSFLDSAIQVLPSSGL